MKNISNYLQKSNLSLCYFQFVKSWRFLDPSKECVQSVNIKYVK